MTPTEIKAAKTSDLVALYNKLTGKNIKKFESRKIAEARTQDAVNNSGKMVAAAVIDEIKVAKTNFALDHSRVVAKSPPPKKMNEQEALEAAAKNSAAIRGTGPRSTGLPGPHSQYAGKKLHRLVSTNPRREGTAGWTSFNCLRNGMTYEEYRLAGGRSNDLAWDVAHGFVEVK